MFLNDNAKENLDVILKHGLGLLVETLLCNVSEICREKLYLTRDKNTQLLFSTPRLDL